MAEAHGSSGGQKSSSGKQGTVPIEEAQKAVAQAHAAGVAEGKKASSSKEDGKGGLESRMAKAASEPFKKMWASLKTEGRKAGETLSTIIGGAGAAGGIGYGAYTVASTALGVGSYALGLGYATLGLAAIPLAYAAGAYVAKKVSSYLLHPLDGIKKIGHALYNAPAYLFQGLLSPKERGYKGIAGYFKNLWKDIKQAVYKPWEPYKWETKDVGKTENKLPVAGASDEIQKAA